jgi:hypothetical protein
MGQGPKWSCLMKKTGGRKSRDRVPLSTTHIHISEADAGIFEI